MDEVDGAPLRRMEHQFKKETLTKEQEDSGFGSLLTNLSGFSSVASNSSNNITDKLNRLQLADRAFNKQLPEEGYESLQHIESIPVCKEITAPQEGNELELLFSPDEDGDTQLHIAIIHGQAHVAKRIIDLAPTADYLNHPNAQRLTPLHMAVLSDQPQLIRHLLGAGCIVEERDGDGNTPLHLACQMGYKSCVAALTQPFMSTQIFQQIPQDMEIKNYNGNTCMHLAAENSQFDTLACLYNVAVKADVNARDGHSGRTVLHHAAEMGNTTLISFLVRVGHANINVLTYSGHTALQLAEGRGHHEVMSLLIAAGARQQSLVSSSESSSEDDMMDSLDDLQINTSAMCT